MSSDSRSRPKSSNHGLSVLISARVWLREDHTGSIHTQCSSWLQNIFISKKYKTPAVLVKPALVCLACRPAPAVPGYRIAQSSRISQSQIISHRPRHQACLSERSATLISGTGPVREDTSSRVCLVPSQSQQLHPPGHPLQPNAPSDPWSIPITIGPSARLAPQAKALVPPRLYI